MMEKWISRSFDVLNPNLSFRGILERLKGTPWRLKGILEAIPRDQYTIRLDDFWSIQENVGHLLDLESLWLQRTRDFIDGKPQLTPAVLSNPQTESANYNTRDIDDIISAFTGHRLVLVNAFEFLRKNGENLQSLHPRLKTPMRPVDLAYFIAEHDDHHLATITLLCEELDIW